MFEKRTDISESLTVAGMSYYHTMELHSNTTKWPEIVHFQWELVTSSHICDRSHWRLDVGMSSDAKSDMGDIFILAEIHQIIQYIWPYYVLDINVY